MTKYRKADAYKLTSAFLYFVMRAALFQSQMAGQELYKRLLYSDVCVRLVNYKISY